MYNISVLTSPEQYIYVIEGLDDVYIQQREDTEELPVDYEGRIYKDIKEALQCVNKDGNILYNTTETYMSDTIVPFLEVREISYILFLFSPTSLDEKHV